MSLLTRRGMMMGSSSPVDGFTLIERAVAAGAGDTLVGTEVEDYYYDADGNVYLDPWICVNVESVLGIDNVEHIAAIMQRKYLSDKKSQYGTLEGYATSDVRAYLSGNYLDGCSEMVKQHARMIQVPLIDTTPVYDKVFIASVINFYADSESGGEKHWKYYKDIVNAAGINQPTAEAVAGRKYNINPNSPNKSVSGNSHISRDGYSYTVKFFSATGGITSSSQLFRARMIPVIAIY